MKKQKIYLETTLFNFCVDESRGKDHINTVKLFERIAAEEYEAFTSVYVVGELERAQKDKRDKMVDLITEYDINVIAENDEALRMRDLYVSKGMIPHKYAMDSSHIAIASVNGLDMIVSMNFEHIVKEKTIKMTERINVQNGYRSIGIYSPEEVMKDEKEDTSDRAGSK